MQSMDIVGGYLFRFILISWGASQVQLFFFCNESILIGPLQKKVETMEAPQNKRFYGKMQCHQWTYLGPNWWPCYAGAYNGHEFGLKLTSITSPKGLSAIIDISVDGWFTLRKRQSVVETVIFVKGLDCCLLVHTGLSSQCLKFLCFFI